MIRMVIERALSSYKFKVDPSKPSSFENNWKNNSKDWLILYEDNCELFRCRCQSVANYCFGDFKSNGPTEHGDTVAPGKFTLALFQEQRKFHGEIHAITQTVDLDGQKINRQAMQIENGFQTGRWLIHDRYSNKLKHDTNYAWSAGCFILSSADLEALNTIFHAYKLTRGTLIPGEIIEIDC